MQPADKSELGGWSVGPPPYGHSKARAQAVDALDMRIRCPGMQRRLVLRLRFVLLFSLAATLSILLPSSWSIWSRRSYSEIAVLNPQSTFQSDPATEWRDDIWPIRATEPWDISADFPYPRTLEYDVTEGTWLRLDVHPATGEIVFDMAGDLYCLPASSYTSIGDSAFTTSARPIMLGVPHDSDPHFSPDGTLLVFRSDAELGVENIWIVPWTGCDSMNIRPQTHASDSRLGQALQLKAHEDALLAQGVLETGERKARRLLREGRARAQRVTNETYRWVSDARFHPSGTKVIATKWYFSSRSLGAGEGWEYPVPSDSATTVSIEPGSGKRVIGRSLARGWSADKYGDQQIGPEQFIWRGNDTLIYSQNVRDQPDGTFTYSKDVHKGIYSIFSRNLTSGVSDTLVDAFPGGASRPELSRDGRTLAFVRRVRDKEALVLKDLETGTIHHIWHGLTYDLSTVSAPMGTYPSFAFTPSDDAVIIWAAGKIYHVPLTTNSFGERVGHATATPSPIPFTAHIEKRLAETRTGSAGDKLLEVETADSQRVYSFRELNVNSDASRAVFSAAGATYVQGLGEGASPAVRIPSLKNSSGYHSPSFVPGQENLVVHMRWSDATFSTFELADLATGKAVELAGIPLGRYYTPVLCACSSRERRIAFVKAGGDVLTGDVVATAKPGLYIGDLSLPSDFADVTSVRVHNVKFVPSGVDAGSPLRLAFVEKNTKLLVQQSARTFVVDLSAAPNDKGEAKEKTLAKGSYSTEMSASASVVDGEVMGKYIAFVEFHQLYITKGMNIKEDEPVFSKPANATAGLARISLDGAHDLAWSRDGSRLFWFLGPFLHSLEVAKLNSCASAITSDNLTFGIQCTRQLLEYQEVFVEHSTQVKQLKDDAKALDAEGVLRPMIIFNATLLDMTTGDLEQDLVQEGVLSIQGGVIAYSGKLEGSSITIPEEASLSDDDRGRFINAHGGLVIPGFIDGHAHWNGFYTMFPAASWEQETFLAYGVTTLHNPSADEVFGYEERSRVESGQIVGPRLFQTGEIMYGAQATYHQDIASMDEAYSALVRIKVEGGPASFSYKNYNLPSRASRQRLLLAARNLSMLCVPEGGMNEDWDLTYIVDGMTTVEHPLPVPVLYDDILNLYALSGTGATPTHIVNYGGAWGEQIVWAEGDIPNDEKLRRFTPHDILESLSESTARPANSFALFNTSTSVAKMVDRGLRAHIGAHGEPPLGLNYHAEMHFAQQGGLSNYEVLKAATSSAAQTLGLSSYVGSLAPGLLADFLVYPPDADFLYGDIRDTQTLKYVARGGRVWDAATMEEVWPVKGRKQAQPPINAE